MSDDSLRPASRIVRRPLHPTVALFPVACFGGTLLTDLAYWRTADMMWADFSAWLVSAGVILAYLAVIVGLVDLLSGRFVGLRALAWRYVIGNLLVLVLATLNMLVHTRDAWTSVVPWGLALSVAVVVVLLFTVSTGWSMLYRRELGVAR